MLQDADGRLPLQRPNIDLAAVSPDVERALSLSRLFDRGFQPRLSDRFPNVHSFRDALANLREAPGMTPDYSEIIARAARLGGGGSAAPYRQRSRALEEVWRWMDRNIRAIQVLTGGEYVVTSSGDYQPGSDHPYRNIGLHHHHRGALNRYWLRIGRYNRRRRRQPRGGSSQNRRR